MLVELNMNFLKIHSGLLKLNINYFQVIIYYCFYVAIDSICHAMSGITGNNSVPENGLATKIENLSVVSSGEQQPLPTSPGSLSETKDSNNQDELLAAAERSLLQKVIRKGLIENKNDLEIQRKDPKSPLYSVKSFEALNLRPQLLKGVYSMGKL